MEKLNNKETINLLDLSDNESDISDLIIITPKKKKIKRRHRSNGPLKVRQNNSFCKHSRMSTISLWLAAIFIVIWLITLSWLAVILYRELKRMDVSVKYVLSMKYQDNTCLKGILHNLSGN